MERNLKHNLKKSMVYRITYPHIIDGIVGKNVVECIDHSSIPGIIPHSILMINDSFWKIVHD